MFIRDVIRNREPYSLRASASVFVKSDVWSYRLVSTPKNWTIEK
jgi:hypothetical protein